MEEIIFNKDENENYGIEITSVSSFIDEVNKLKMICTGAMRNYFSGVKKLISGMLFQVFLEVIF